MSLSFAKALDRLAGGAALQALRPVRALQDLLSGYPPPGPIREIALVKFWGLGNAALLLPVLASLRRRYPAARLTAVTLRENAPLWSGAADRVLTVRLKPAGTLLLDLMRVTAALRAPRIDLALDCEQYVRTSQLLLYLAGARQVIAFDTTGLKRATLANVKVPYDDSRHASESFQDLARAAGVKEPAPLPGGLRVEPEAARRAELWARGQGSPPRPLVLLHPGSGDNFPGRRWPTRRFGLLARRLALEENAVVGITGIRSEAPLAREVAEAAGCEIRDLCGRLALPDLVALLARAALVVSNDTGPVHLASALGVPVLGLYGPNTPRIYGPLSPGSVAFYDAPPCSPCITNFNYKTSRCRNPVCIEAIPLASVADAALARLRARRAGNTA
ncbi:MAG: glycosyltransferase family 9 protein [Planctomycetaceae bacterium]